MEERRLLSRLPSMKSRDGRASRWSSRRPRPAASCATWSPTFGTCAEGRGGGGRKGRSAGVGGRANEKNGDSLPEHAHAHLLDGSEAPLLLQLVHDHPDDEPSALCLVQQPQGPGGGQLARRRPGRRSRQAHPA